MYILRILTVFGLLVGLIGGTRNIPVKPDANAYTDPALVTKSDQMLSVIVTGQDAVTAADAVAELGGTVTSNLWLIDAVGAMIPGEQINALASTPGIRAIVENKKTAATTSDSPDWVEQWGTMATDLAWPISVDVGADQLHITDTGEIGLTGFRIGVAVLDSGVYFSPSLNHLNKTGYKTMKFKEQVDFVGDGTCQNEDGIQYSGYCLHNRLGQSLDPYGHGTHVGSIIANQMAELNSGKALGVAPQSPIYSIRVLNELGEGNYEDTIEGIQYAVQAQDSSRIRILNLSLSAQATVPYFVDPLNRAVEAAWASGLVVVAAAGNEGPNAESITVPGNDPYVITVGAIDTNGTPGDWSDDVLPSWSATGPTADGFVKPDVLAPGGKVIALMHNDDNGSASLVQNHPDYSEGNTLFRMSGTSMATAVTSGVVALMLQNDPSLTPDQVKFRLMYSARPAINGTDVYGDDINYSLLQQGAGRIWAPDAVLGEFPSDGEANTGMDIQQDLAHDYSTEAELANHYQGPIRKLTSDDGSTVLYYAEADDGTIYGFGGADANGLNWLDLETLTSGYPTWAGGSITMNSGMNWAGGYSNSAGYPTWAGGYPTWAGGFPTWAGGMAWAGGFPTWAGGMNWAGGYPAWAGGMAWAGGFPTWAGGMNWGGGMAWAGGYPTWAGTVDSTTAGVAATSWVNDEIPLTVSIADMDGSSACEDADCRWRGTVTIAVQDAVGALVPGATVEVQWLHETNSGLKTCTTKDDGTCSVGKTTGKNKTSITFTVVNIDHGGLVYVSRDNTDPDGDSDGTAITVYQPGYLAAAAMAAQAPLDAARGNAIFMPFVNAQK